MKLKDILKILFGKLLKNENERGDLVNVLDTVILPTREMFKSNSEILKLIDLYKNHYREKLKSRIFTSVDLKLDDLINNMNMNIDLVLKHLLYENKNTEIDYQVDYAKLNLYLQEIENLEIKNIARFIALNELLRDIRYIFSINRRNAINQELTSLLNIMNIFRSQKLSVNLEIENSKFKIIHNNVDKKINNDIKRRDMAIKYGGMVLPRELLQIYNEAYISISVYTAIIERALEIYVYKNKNLINNLKEDLKILENADKTTENKDKLLEKIKDLECKYQLFNLYGFNLINKEDLMSFYRVKFDIITIDINKQDKSPITCSTHSKEFKCYEEIISEKLRNIYNGHGIEIEKFIKIKSLKNLLKILDYLFKFDKKFNYIDILKHIEDLALVLAFEKEGGLNNYFLEVKKETSPYYWKFFHGYEDQITFEEKIPLETICQVIDSFINATNIVDKIIDIVVHRIKMGDYKNQPFDIYALYLFKTMIYRNENVNNNEYYIPEGISIIDNLDTDDPYPFLEDIRKKSNCIENENDGKLEKNVIFPSTLKAILGKPFGNIKIYGLILNEGLDFIDDNAFYNQESEFVVIPSTLNNIKLGTFDYESIIKLKFTNFKNSRILSDLLYSDNPNYKAIIGKMFYIFKDYLGKSYIDTYLCDIYLYDELNNVYDIDYSEIEIELDEYYQNDKEDILETDIKLIREHLISLIYEKTGYKIKPYVEDDSLYNTKILRKDKYNVYTKY